MMERWQHFYGGGSGQKNWRCIAKENFGVGWQKQLGSKVAKTFWGNDYFLPKLYFLTP